MIHAQTLLEVLVVALIAGLLWWGLTLIPLPEPIATIVRVAFVIGLVLFLLGVLFGQVPLPRVRW